jgi:hypothetical protein
MTFKLGINLVKSFTPRYKIEADTGIKGSYSARIRIWGLRSSEKQFNSF